MTSVLIRDTQGRLGTQKGGRQGERAGGHWSNGVTNPRSPRMPTATQNLKRLGRTLPPLELADGGEPHLHLDFMCLASWTVKYISVASSHPVCGNLLTAATWSYVKLIPSIGHLGFLSSNCYSHPLLASFRKRLSFLTDAQALWACYTLSLCWPQALSRSFPLPHTFLRSSYETFQFQFRRICQSFSYGFWFLWLKKKNQGLAFIFSLNIFFSIFVFYTL